MNIAINIFAVQCVPQPAGNQLVKWTQNYDTVASCLRWEQAPPCNKLLFNSCQPSTSSDSDNQPCPKLGCDEAAVSPPQCGSQLAVCPY